MLISVQSNFLPFIFIFYEFCTYTIPLAVEPVVLVLFRTRQSLHNWVIDDRMKVVIADDDDDDDAARVG